MSGAGSASGLPGRSGNETAIAVLIRIIPTTISQAVSYDRLFRTASPAIGPMPRPTWTDTSM